MGIASRRGPHGWHMRRRASSRESRPPQRQALLPARGRSTLVSRYGSPFPIPANRRGIYSNGFRLQATLRRFTGQLYERAKSDRGNGIRGLGNARPYWRLCTPDRCMPSRCHFTTLCYDHREIKALTTGIPMVGQCRSGRVWLATTSRGLTSFTGVVIDSPLEIWANRVQPT